MQFHLRQVIYQGFTQRMPRYILIHKGTIQKKVFRVYKWCDNQENNLV